MTFGYEHGKKYREFRWTLTMCFVFGSKLAYTKLCGTANMTLSHRAYILSLGVLEVTMATYLCHNVGKKMMFTVFESIHSNCSHLPESFWLFWLEITVLISLLPRFTYSNIGYLFFDLG